MSSERSFRAGRYRVVGVLGEGSQAETLDAIDGESGRHVAVKRFLVRGAQSWKDVELAEREARVLAQLTHQRLPRYLDAFEEDGALVLVMEKVEGESLAAMRKRGGTLDRKQVLRLLEEMGEVFEYLHGRAPPIIHRDVKPGNVLLRPDGSFALVDFGSVRDSLKPEGGSTVVGTFGYMAPEQFQGRAFSQSDVYSLGATALSLLTGRDPESLPHRGLAIDVPAVLAHDPPLAGVLSRMLDPDPDRRAQRVRPLLDALPRERQSEPGAGPPRGAVEPSGPRLPGGMILLIVLLGLAVARFSTVALFRVFLPVLLTVLSVFFGSGLRRTAKQMKRIGEQGEEGLRRAREAVWGDRSHRDHRRKRQRVIDTQGEAVDEAERERQREQERAEREHWREHKRKARQRRS